MAEISRTKYTEMVGLLRGARSQLSPGCTLQLNIENFLEKEDEQEDKSEADQDDQSNVRPVSEGRESVEG